MGVNIGSDIGFIGSDAGAGFWVGLALGCDLGALVFGAEFGFKAGFCGRGEAGFGFKAGFCGRGDHFLWAHVYSACCLQPAVRCTVHRPVCRLVGSHVHYCGSTNFRDEYKPGTFLWIGTAPAALERALALFHRPSARNASGCGSLHTGDGNPSRLLCQAASPQPEALYLQLLL